MVEISSKMFPMRRFALPTCVYRLFFHLNPLEIGKMELSSVANVKTIVQYSDAVMENCLFRK